MTTRRLQWLIWFSTLAVSARATIPDQIDAILSGAAVAGNSWSILVENETGSTIYYQRNPTTGYAPASNTKMFTTAAAIGLLGTNYAFQTRIYRNGPLTGGVLTGDLNLVCDHDPTWNTSVFSGNPRKPLDTIAGALLSLGVTNVTGNVQCYGLCSYDFGSTDSLSATTTTAKNAKAATNFVAALVAKGIAVGGIPVGLTGFSPPGTLLHTYYSTNNTYGGKPLRLDVACIPLLKVSHNVMADVMLRHIGWKLGTGDTYSAGAAKVVPWLKNTAGLTTNGIVMNDGSGLSHGNRFSARQTIALTRYMLGAFPSWDDGFPIGCVDGTLGGRFCGTDGSGTVRAKTGSLSISIALSGYIDNTNDGERYLFSFIGNDTGGIDQTATRDAIDAAVVLFGARGVPLSPELTQVISRPNGTSLRLNWSNEDFIRTGYRVYGSSNGVNFSALADVATNVHTYTDSGLPTGIKKYYKVSVLGSGGESKASRIYGAKTGGAPRVLIVDGDDRWQFQTAENPNCTNHNFCALAGQNISGPVFETAHHNAVADGSVVLSNYPAVVWLNGEEGSVDDAFSAVEQTQVTDYLAGGGNIFVSGSETAWDLDRASGPTAADRNFYRTVLRTAYVADDAGTYAFASTGSGVFSNNAVGGFDNGTKGTYNVDFPDVLVATNGGIAALTYSGGTGGAAAIQYNGSGGGGKVVNWGFPFETITNSAARDAYMSDVLRFFGVLPPPSVAQAQFNPGANTFALTWVASAGLKYRVQFKTNLTDAVWQNLANDVTATNTAASKVDVLPPGMPQRFYRVMLVD